MALPVLGVSRGVAAGVVASIGACIVALAATLPWLAMVVLAVVLTFVAIAARRALSISGVIATRDAQLAEQAATRERLEHAVALAGIGTWHWDIRRSTVDYDSSCAKMLGYVDGEVASTLAAWGKLVHPDDLAAARRDIDALIDGKVDHYEVRVRLRAADGSWRTILDRGRAIAFGADGRPSHLVGVHIDVTSASAGSLTPPPKGRWVIVDDDDSVRAVIEAAARRHGLETVSFADPRRAWAAISAGGAPLGIITDYEMPEMSGVQFAERVRAAGISCPILLVSGSTSPALNECRSIDGMLDKPFTIAKLMQWLDRNSGTKAERRD